MIHQCREFFLTKLNFLEVPSQCRLSILAACEDPSNITNFQVNQTLYPLPQTGQMWLELELLKNPSLPGVFCITTSYRDEKNPIEGRHNRIFPMFEFEAPGNMDDLRNLEADLLAHLGFSQAAILDYEAICAEYNIVEIKADHELQLQKQYGNVLSLENFPERTQPFWNMKSNDDGTYSKIDVILHGMETIGSAQREVDPVKMRERFYSISGGEYSELLFKHFGRARVEKELEEYLSLNFFERFGAGMGLTRLERAMELSGLFWNQENYVESMLAANRVEVAA